jgi:hypothetical protein
VVLLVSFFQRLWANSWIPMSESLEKLSTSSFRSLRALSLIGQSPSYAYRLLTARTNQALTRPTRFRVFTETFGHTVGVLLVVLVLVAALIYSWSIIGVEVFNSSFAAYSTDTYTDFSTFGNAAYANFQMLMRQGWEGASETLPDSKGRLSLTRGRRRSDL